MRDYQRSPEELKQILEEHEAKFGADRDSTIKTVDQYIDEATETHQLDVDYIWTYTDHMYYSYDGEGPKFYDSEQYYNAYLCKMPEMKG